MGIFRGLQSLPKGPIMLEQILQFNQKYYVFIHVSTLSKKTTRKQCNSSIGFACVLYTYECGRSHQENVSTGQARF